MAMAGIWDVWQQGNYAIKTFSIITTPPNAEMSTIHTRMPVIFENELDRRQWLDNIPLPQILELLKTPSDGILTRYRVSEKLNSVKNNSPDLHQELPELPSLF